MQVFITSTPEELTPYRKVAADVVRGLGLEPVLGRGDDRPVAAHLEQVASADLLISLVGHRRGEVPPPEIGGDGFHPWAWWETHAAFEHHRPVKVLMAAEDWRPDLREPKARAAAVMRDFRGELRRLAALFDEDDETFRDLVRQQLDVACSATRASLHLGGEPLGETTLRHWPPPPLPDHPYPVLLPYTHPDLMAGRDRELRELRDLLAGPVPILGLHAPSGTGKSSFLAGGLVAALRAEGRPVAFDRHPGEPGLAERLLGDLADGDVRCSEEDPTSFVDRLCAVRAAAGEPPVLVLDQFEDLLRTDGPRRARAVVGLLLAASVQRQPGLYEAPCRWVLAYRQDFHGKVVQWLEDVLRDASAEGMTAARALPHDLAEPERFQAWNLSPLGTPPPGSEDPVGDATWVFLDAITKPLDYYPLRFKPGLAEQLARSFGEARLRSPRAPLGPELQVMLAHVLATAAPAAASNAEAAEPGTATFTMVVEMAEHPGTLIEEALEEHLRRALDIAFPGERHRLERTRALLALRELADEGGRRGDGLSADVLARAIGEAGEQALEKLATAGTRIVVAHSAAIGERFYVLSHDRMAEVVARLVDEGRFAGLGVDGEVLGLRRFVALHSELDASGEVEQATAVPPGRLRRIEENADALLWSDAQRRWLEACRERQRRDRRRRRFVLTAAFLAVAMVALAAWQVTSRRAARQALLKEFIDGDPATAFAALDRWVRTEEPDEAEFRALFGERENAFNIFVGVEGVPKERRGPAVVRLADLLLPLEKSAEMDPYPIAMLVWALDFFARGPDVAERATALRKEALRHLRRSYPPPMPPPRDGPLWADIPAGTVVLPDGGAVEVQAFRMMVREVTFGEYRRLFPGVWPQWSDELPAGLVGWHEAYAYAAWLGGRLPTEAEWVYAAQAGCRYEYCKADGTEASIDEVGRYLGNSYGSREAGSGEDGPMTVPGMRYESNPWGLFDMYGNAQEWTADLAMQAPQEGTAGSDSVALGYRWVKGGGAESERHELSPEFRRPLPITANHLFIGFRVILPGPATMGRLPGAGPDAG